MPGQLPSIFPGPCEKCALSGSPERPLEEAAQIFMAEAIAIHQADIEACRAIGRYGAELIDDGDCVLTHCNAGALATGGYGTALGVIPGGLGSG